MKIFASAFVSLGLLALSAQSVVAQTSYWSQCAESTSIARCETYNCPLGDTNRDGVCDLKDTQASQTDSRNDSFCANPPSGCGQVLYFSTNQNNSCAVRVKQNENNCNLYKASNPNFATASSSPVATLAPTSTPSSRLNTLPVPASSSTPKPAKSLPETGPELWVSIFLAALGMYGLYLYEKPRKQNN